MSRQAGRGSRKGFRGTKQSSQGKSNAPAKREVKKTLSDYNYYLGSAKQASDYETTTQYIINHVKKTFDYGNDIGQALMNLVLPDIDFWRPDLRASTLTDDAAKATENEKFKMEFQYDYEEFRKRTITLDNNKTKAYALIWERCNKGMKNKIESRTDFATIQDDPILLLKAIKEHALNYQEHRYSMAIIFESMYYTLQYQAEGQRKFTRLY